MDGLPPVGMRDDILVAREFGCAQTQVLPICKLHNVKWTHKIASMRTLKGWVQNLLAAVREPKFKAPLVECAYLYLELQLRTTITVRNVAVAVKEVREVARRFRAINAKRQRDFVILASSSFEARI